MNNKVKVYGKEFSAEAFLLILALEPANGRELALELELTLTLALAHCL
ncbi:MAG: hypothetical protein R6W90_11095 [Ignavibacteriaceae bacterium]